MTPRHKLLAIQLRKHFGGEAGPGPDCSDFLDAVDAAYQQFDRDLQLSRQSLALSTEELLGAYDRLKADREQERQILDALRNSARRLLDGPDAVSLESANAGSLVDLMDRLIREREHHARELAHREAQYRSVVDNVREVIFHIDTEGRWAFLNPAWTHITGFTVEETLGRPFSEFVAPEDRQRIVDKFRQIVAGGGPQHHDEVRCLTRAGGIQWVEVYARLLRGPGGESCGITGTLNDITSRKRSESALLQSQKLESLGVLAGGIAHDFNNLLVAIMGNAELAGMYLQNDAKAQKHLEQVQSATARAAELCRQLLAYSGKGRFVVETLDLNALVQDLVNLLKVSIHKNIALEFHLLEQLPSIEIDATQIRQAVMNLVINASDAISPKPGVIRVETGVAPLPREVLDHPHLSHDLPTQDCVYIRVTDTGCGMDEETQKRIFDPFFTTKFTGRGLGLAAIMGIIRSHRGAIHVTSAPGRGTQFTLYFPKAALTAPAHAAPHLGVHEWRTTGTILLVEDEESVRELATEALSQLGFTVLQAHHGQEGVELFTVWKDTIDVVLLDLTMPVMNGDEVFQAIQALRPNTPVILMSGYSEQESKTLLNAQGLAGFLQKPFRLAELRQLLKKTLSGDPLEI